MCLSVRGRGREGKGQAGAGTPERQMGNQLGLGRQARGQKPTVKWSRTKATAPMDRRRNPVSMTYK